MYLKIIDLVKYMQYEHSVFNPFEYELYFNDEISDDEKVKEILSGSKFAADKLFRKNVSFSEEEIKSFLAIPHVSEMEAVEGFIIALEKKQKLFIEKKLGEAFDINSFYDALLDMGIEEKWERFYFEYRKKIAIEWCDRNGIIYTEKE